MRSVGTSSVKPLSSSSPKPKVVSSLIFSVVDIATLRPQNLLERYTKRTACCTLRQGSKALKQRGFENLGTLELPLIQVLARRMEAPERWTSPSETKRSHPAATPWITPQATRPATRWRAGPSCQFLDAALLPLLSVRHRPTPNATRCGKHSHICIISHAIQTNSSFSAGAPSSTYRGADAAWPSPPSRLADRARASLPLARSLCRYTGVIHLRTGSTHSAGARPNVQGRTYRGRILRDSPTMWDRGV